MVKNYNEEKNVVCEDCGEEVEKEYTKICSNAVVCDQCFIDAGGDHQIDGELSHDIDDDIALDIILGI